MIDKCENKCADKCDDQAPIFSKSGRGLRGDSYSVKVFDDGLAQNLTWLEAYKYDAITKTETKVWTSDNVNGGRLECFYHLNQNDIPKTFTLTFVYTRPASPNTADAHKRTRWAFTTPAIPYMFEGKTPMQGSVVGTVFLRDHSKPTDDMYKEMLTYPKVAGATPDRDDFNAPYPPGGVNKLVAGTRSGDPTHVNSTFLPDGSEWNVYLDIVELDELAKITGLERGELLQIIQDVKRVIKSSNYEGMPTDLEGVEADDIVDYINKLVGKENQRRKEECAILRERIRKLEQYVSALAAANNTAFQELLNRMYGTKDGHAGTAAVTQIDIPEGETTLTKIPKVNINWDGLASDGMIPTGNMNVYSELARNDNEEYPVYIKTHGNPAEGDYKVK